MCNKKTDLKINYLFIPTETPRTKYGYHPYDTVENIPDSRDEDFECEILVFDAPVSQSSYVDPVHQSQYKKLMFVYYISTKN